MSAIDGDEWESSEPNPLHRAVSRASSPRALAKKAKKAVDIEGLGSLIWQESKEAEVEVRMENIYPNANDDDEGPVKVEEARKREDNDGDELAGSAVMHNVDCMDGSLFGEVEEECVEEDSSTIEMSGTDSLIPLPRKDRRRSFKADEQNLMLKLDNSLSSIYSSLERLRVRKRVAALTIPTENSLILANETGKKIEAWLRLSQSTLSRSDLLALGPFPLAIHSLMKQNEGVLWAMFRCYYPPNCRVLPSVAPADSSNSKNEYKRRVLSLSSIWDLLRDFNICPDLCTYVPLITSRTSRIDLPASLEIPPSPSECMTLITLYFTPYLPPSKIALIETIAAITSNSSILSPDQSHTQLLLSFDSFLKLLWRIAVDHLVVAPTASPRARMLALLERMDA